MVFLSDAEAQSISSVSLLAASCWLQSLHVFFLKGKTMFESFRIKSVLHMLMPCVVVDLAMAL